MSPLGTPRTPQKTFEVQPLLKVPFDDRNSYLAVQARPLSLLECLLMLLLVSSPLILAAGHEWYDARFNPVTRQAIAEAKALREANAELMRIVLLERSRVAAMKEAAK